MAEKREDVVFGGPAPQESSRFSASKNRRRSKKDIVYEGYMLPKRPLNSFFIYCREHQDALKRDHPDYSSVDLRIALSTKWNWKLSKDDKTIYEAKFHEQSAEYDRKMAVIPETIRDELLRQEKARCKRKRPVVPNKDPISPPIKSQRTETEANTVSTGVTNIQVEMPRSPGLGYTPNYPIQPTRANNIAPPTHRPFPPHPMEFVPFQPGHGPFPSFPMIERGYHGFVPYPLPPQFPQGPMYPPDIRISPNQSMIYQRMEPIPQMHPFIPAHPSMKGYPPGYPKWQYFQQPLAPQVSEVMTPAHRGRDHIPEVRPVEISSNEDLDMRGVEIVTGSGGNRPDSPPSRPVEADEEAHEIDVAISQLLADARESTEYLSPGPRTETPPPPAGEDLDINDTICEEIEMEGHIEWIEGVREGGEDEKQDEAMVVDAEVIIGESDSSLPQTPPDSDSESDDEPPTRSTLSSVVSSPNVSAERSPGRSPCQQFHFDESPPRSCSPTESVVSLSGEFADDEAWRSEEDEEEERPPINEDCEVLECDTVSLDAGYVPMNPPHEPPPTQNTGGNPVVSDSDSGVVTDCENPTEQTWMSYYDLKIKPLFTQTLPQCVPSGPTHQPLFRNTTVPTADNPPVPPCRSKPRMTYKEILDHLGYVEPTSSFYYQSGIEESMDAIIETEFSSEKDENSNECTSTDTDPVVDLCIEDENDEVVHSNVPEDLSIRGTLEKLKPDLSEMDFKMIDVNFQGLRPSTKSTQEVTFIDEIRRVYYSRGYYCEPAVDVSTTAVSSRVARNRNCTCRLSRRNNIVSDYEEDDEEDENCETESNIGPSKSDLSMDTRSDDDPVTSVNGGHLSPVAGQSAPPRRVNRNIVKNNLSDLDYELGLDTRRLMLGLRPRTRPGLQWPGPEYRITSDDRTQVTIDDELSSESDSGSYDSDDTL